MAAMQSSSASSGRELLGPERIDQAAGVTQPRRAHRAESTRAPRPAGPPRVRWLASASREDIGADDAGAGGRRGRPRAPTCAPWPRPCRATGSARTSRRTSAPRWRRAKPPSATPRFTCATVGGDGGHGAGRPRRRPVAGQRGGRRQSARRAGARPVHVSPLAVDSDATIDAAARAGVGEVLIDVNVGLPRCGCRARGRRADWPTGARRAGLGRAWRHGVRGAHRGARGSGERGSK